MPRVPVWDSAPWILGGDTGEPNSEYLELGSERPSVLLVGCSYVACQHLPREDRLLDQLRRWLPGFSISSVAASGGGLVSNLRHIAHFLPHDYDPLVVVIAPSQSFRQYIPASSVEFNACPYGLWQQYYFVEGQSELTIDSVRAECLARDLLRLEFLVEEIFPDAHFAFTLWDSSDTSEITLISPKERQAFLRFIARHGDRCSLTILPDEMNHLYRELGPFDGTHPNRMQVRLWAARCAQRVLEVAEGLAERPLAAPPPTVSAPHRLIRLRQFAGRWRLSRILSRTKRRDDGPPNIYPLH